MQLQTDEQQQEVKDHGHYEFPVFISQEVLSRYERGSFIWHWHTEVELTLVVEGQISYQVNERVYELKAGDGLFCNSNALHTGRMKDKQDCYYISITFHPRILYGFEGSLIWKKFVQPMLSDPACASMVFHRETSWQEEILGWLDELYTEYLKPGMGYEMEVQQNLSKIWLSLFENVYAVSQREKTKSGKERPGREKGAAENRNIERIRQILAFIQEHYMEKITLEDIAGQVHLCRSECCRFFKNYMQRSLFDYLLYYRLEKSLPLLGEHHLSVTETAERTGFSSPEYFAKVFREQMGCTPSFYRSGREKKNQNPI